MKRRQVRGDKEELIMKAMQLLTKSNLKLSADVGLAVGHLSHMPHCFLRESQRSEPKTQ